MILACQLNTNIHINVLEDLNKLKSLIENNNLKVNISRLARELGKDRRTVKKYIDGYVKTNKRQRQSQFDTYYPLIKELLNDANKLFAYKRVLFQYLKDNYGMPGASSIEDISLLLMNLISISKKKSVQVLKHPLIQDSKHLQVNRLSLTGKNQLILPSTLVRLSQSIYLC